MLHLERGANWLHWIEFTFEVKPSYLDNKKSQIDKDQLTSANISVDGSSLFAILQKIQVSSRQSSEESCLSSEAQFSPAILTED